MREKYSGWWKLLSHDERMDYLEANDQKYADYEWDEIPYWVRKYLKTSLDYELRETIKSKNTKNEEKK